VALVLGIIVMISAVAITFSGSFFATGVGWTGSSFPVLSLVITTVLMFAGIVFGCLYRRLVGPDRQVNPLHELRQVFTSTSFLAALCVSPFVFMAVYAVVANTPGDPASYLLAFQNGFFCESIFKQITDKRKAGEPATAEGAA
jgi:hypothetical protein